MALHDCKSSISPIPKMCYQKLQLQLMSSNLLTTRAGRRATVNLALRADILLLSQPLVKLNEILVSLHLEVGVQEPRRR
jgi:hypothetical protein